MLKRLNEMVLKLEKVSSTIDKKHIIRKYPDLKPLLRLIYNPRFILNITGDTVINISYIKQPTKLTSIIELLHILNKRERTGLDAINLCNNFINENSDYGNIIVRILNKDLKCGISYKTINAVFPCLIPEFKVPLANEYKKGLCDFREEWFASRKLDGVRCLVFIKHNGDIESYSRKGIKFETLKTIENEIGKTYLGENNVVLDGEVCIVDKNGNESFKGIMSEIRRKDHTINNPRFYIFDAYYIKDFENGRITQKPFVDFAGSSSRVEFLSQIKVKNKEHFIQLVKDTPGHWEGLMLRKNPTEFKRSNNLLKFKKFKDIELKVRSVLTGEKIINGVLENCVSSLLCYYEETYPVQIGSGLTDGERILWYKNPKSIIGKTITVKYFEECTDKKGDKSLRFPVFKGIRND